MTAKRRPSAQTMDRPNDPLAMPPRTAFLRALRLDGEPLTRASYARHLSAMGLAVHAARTETGWTFLLTAGDQEITQSGRLAVETTAMSAWFDAFRDALAPFPLQRAYMALRRRPSFGALEAPPADAEEARRILGAFAEAELLDYRRNVRALLDEGRPGTLARARLLACGPLRRSFHGLGVWSKHPDPAPIERLREELHAWLLGLKRLMLQTQQPLASAHARAAFFKDPPENAP